MASAFEQKLSKLRPPRNDLGPRIPRDIWKHYQALQLILIRLQIKEGNTLAKLLGLLAPALLGSPVPCLVLARK